MRIVVKNIWIFITIFLVGAIAGFCTKSIFFNPKEVEYITNNQNITPIDKLEQDIIKKGDINSYNELRISYIDKEMFTFLPWALVMTNKYHNKDAYFNVFSCLFYMNCLDCTSEELENWSLAYLDNATKEFAIAYLKEASRLGHGQAKDILDIYTKNNNLNFTKPSNQK